jgi:hypothetical protein
MGAESPNFISLAIAHLACDCPTHYKPKRLKKTSLRLRADHYDKIIAGDLGIKRTADVIIDPYPQSEEV